MVTALLVVVAAAPLADLALVGVVLTPRAEGRVAVVESGGRTRVAAIGETVFGLTVTAIAEGEVVLQGDGEALRLRVGPARAPALVPAAFAHAAGPAADPSARELPRADVVRRIGEESSRILAETTLVPVIDNGRAAGFTLTRIPENSLLTDAGLRAGDVLVEVNGTPVDSLATLIGLWPRLQSESMVRATVLRNGEPVSLSVALR